MKNRIYQLFVFVCVFVCVSCELKREDYTEISPDNFPKTEKDLCLSVNALMYEFGTGYWNGEGIYSANYGGYQVMSDMSTDLFWSCWGWESDDLYYHQWDASANTQSLAKYHYQNFAHYQFLSKARNTIRRIEKSDAPEDEKKHYAAEAHGLRAWMALYLYDFFGPVPVATDEQLDDPTTFYYLSRLTDEQYDQMIDEDVAYAVANLDDSKYVHGRMSRGAALMIAMKYYMIRRNYAKAESLCRQIIKLGQYNLLPNYAHVFDMAHIGNAEVILSVGCQASNAWTTNYMTAEVLPADMAWTDNSAGWGGYVMPWDFYNTFEEGDARAAADLIYTQYTDTKGKLITSSSQLSYGALPLKAGKDPNMTGANANNDLVVFRYADVLLCLSECITRQKNAVDDEAVNLLNQVRLRAGLKAITPGSPEVMLEALLLERGHEFYMEGLRRQDLIRFDKYAEYAQERINKAIAAGTTLAITTIDKEQHERWPIPTAFIDESKSHIQQNPKYNN